jgi:hypothetical protein
LKSLGFGVLEGSKRSTPRFPVASLIISVRKISDLRSVYLRRIGLRHDSFSYSTVTLNTLLPESPGLVRELPFGEQKLREMI